MPWFDGVPFSCARAKVEKSRAPYSKMSYEYTRSQIQRRKYCRFTTQISRILSFQVQIPVRPMNYRRHPRYRPPQKIAECLHNLKPVAHLWRSDRVPSHLLHPGRTQAKQVVMSGGSVKSPRHRLLGDQLAKKNQGMTKRTIHDSVLHSSANSDGYSACRPAVPLDKLCPYMDYHRKGQDSPTQHPISTEDLVLSLKRQLDEDIDRCMPLGNCCSYGAPFKLSYMKYGYCTRSSASVPLQACRKKFHAKRG